jgi:hypothetical protein
MPTLLFETVMGEFAIDESPVAGPTNIGTVFAEPPLVVTVVCAAQLSTQAATQNAHPRICFRMVPISYRSYPHFGF